MFNAHKMQFSAKDFFRKSEQILSFLRIWSHLLRKPLTENFRLYILAVACLLLFLVNPF